MRLLSLVTVIIIIILASIFMYSVARTKTGAKSDIFMLPDMEDYENSLEKTHVTIRHRPYPKDLNMTRSLLSKRIGENHTKNGVINYPSIYIKPYGRLGNNIIQLFDAIYLCEIMNVTTIYIDDGFCFINSPITTSKGIKIIPVNEKPAEALSLEIEIFGMTYEDYCPEDRVYEFASETLKSVPKVKVNDNGLYIHIRSGDIFAKKPNHYYGQPPLCFYESIINTWGFKDIYILTEDRMNPVIDRLVQEYKAKVIITDLFQVVGFILNAKNLAVSFGTFVPSILKLVPEDPEKRIFRYGNGIGINVDIWKKFYYTDVSENYRNNILKNNWKNTEEQREMMLNETCGDKWKISLYTNYSHK